jgi:membrane-associated protein
MHGLKDAIDIVLHLDVHLNQWAGTYGAWLYAILSAVIFAETGLVVTPFLPGDSLLFAVGALAAGTGSPLNIVAVFLVLVLAAVAGNTTNYHIGRWMGPKAMNHDGRFLKKKYLDETHAFFERFGGLTIIVTRFVPIVRTFAPFVAGVGKMTYLHFQFFNVAGGVLWVALLVFAGYFFGNVPLVKHNFSLVVIAIVIISILPGVVGYLRARQTARKGTA